METGRYLVLGTMHVAVKTAEALDAWALLAPGERPLAVASTHYGWFIPTRNPEEPDRSEIPPEVLEAMRQGREQGCNYLLFGRSPASPSFPGEAVAATGNGRKGGGGGCHTQEALMPNPDTLALLREALEFLNDRPNFGLRRDRRFTSYALASRIDAHIATLLTPGTEHPAVAVSRQQYGDDDRISIDEPEYHVSESEAVIWVRAWLRIDRSALPDVSLAVGEAYRRAVDALPTMARDVFLLVRVNELDYRVIASLLNITVAQVEQYLADALVRIAHALDNDAAGS